MRWGWTCSPTAPFSGMLYSQLPRRAWRQTKVFVQLGDSNGQTWCGPGGS